MRTESTGRNPWKPTILTILAALAFSAAVFVMWPPSQVELMWGAIFVAWVLLMVFKASKLVSRRLNKYIARKFIHFTTGGLVAIAAPFIFETPTVPIIGAVGMALMTIIPRFWGRDLDWYQVENNFGDTWFCISFAVLFLLFWYVDKWIAVVPALFMAYGDGVTGIVRSIIYKDWIKGWWGTVAMLAISLPIGAALKGVAGLISALAATAVEKMPQIDDNITVPAVAAAVLYVLRGLGI
mgnify:CR=1 FL=1